MRYLILCLFVLGCLSQAQGQHKCITMQSEEMDAQFRRNKKTWDELKTRSMPSFIPVTFHLVADNDGLGRPSEQLMYRALCILNQRFEDSNTQMHFYLKGFTEINRSAIYSDPQGNGQLISAFRDNFSMNIFIVNDITQGSGGGTTLGYYSGGRDFIVMLKSSPGDAGYTMEHEIGHFFTLRHTHYGWEDEPFNRIDYVDSKVNFETLPGSSQTPQGIAINVELQDGSNCDDAGDNICDTPPDYGVGFTCGCCNMPYPILDPNCDTIQSQMQNVMSYSSGCGIFEFTEGQSLAMQASYQSNERAYLRTNITQSAYTPVNEPVTIISPANLETVEVFDNVVFTWEPVTNAEFYILTVNSEEYRTSDTEFVLTSLNANSGFNRYTVEAFGPFGGGCAGSTQVIFNTGSTSAVNELDFVDQLSIFPNPITKQEDLNIVFNSTENIEGEILMFSMTGQNVYKAKSRINASSNTFRIPTQDLSSGIYILEIKTDSGSITEKIIID